jgi:hypothetical protein
MMNEEALRRATAERHGENAVKVTLLITPVTLLERGRRHGNVQRLDT